MRLMSFQLNIVVSVLVLFLTFTHSPTWAGNEIEQAQLTQRATNRAEKRAFSVTNSAAAGEKMPPEFLPNILFLVVDTLRADRPGCYGSDLSTPGIDKIASDGVLFENAFCQIPLTLPSHTAIFSSRYPFETHIYNNSQHVDDSVALLAEIFRDAGYETFSVVSLGTMADDTNLGQGFGLYEDNFTTWFRRADEVTEVTRVNVLDKISNDRPWFVFVHFSDPHEPYHAHGLWQNQVNWFLNGEKVYESNVSDRVWHFTRVLLRPGINHLEFSADSKFLIKDLGFSEPAISWKIPRGKKQLQGRDSFRPCTQSQVVVVNPRNRDIKTDMTACIFDHPDIEQVRAGYDKETEYVDRNIQTIMRESDKRGLLENTIVVFSSDHGESLGEHGYLGHSKNLYNPSIRIPLIISFPDRLPKSERINENVRSIDILPTLLELANLKSIHKLEGRSLLPVIYHREKQSRPVLSMTFTPKAPANLVAFVEGSRKLIKNLDNDSYRLFDLQADPQETKNLTGSDMVLFNRMKKRMMECLSETGLSQKTISENTKKIHLDEKRRRALEALGYIQ